MDSGLKLRLRTIKPTAATKSASATVSTVALLALLSAARMISSSVGSGAVSSGLRRKMPRTVRMIQLKGLMRIVLARPNNLAINPLLRKLFAYRCCRGRKKYASIRPKSTDFKNVAVSMKMPITTTLAIRPVLLRTSFMRRLCCSSAAFSSRSKASSEMPSSVAIACKQSSSSFPYSLSAKAVTNNARRRVSFSSRVRLSSPAHTAFKSGALSSPSICWS